MEKYKIDSLYSEMMKKIKKRPYQVLKETKSLALSNQKYNTFYKSSSDTLQTKSFKLPNESQYPKLIKSKYISLQKKINTFSFGSKNLKKSFIRPKSAINNVKSTLVEKLKKRKNVNFFVGENYYRRKYPFSPKYSNYYLGYINNSIYDNDNKNYYPSFSIKNSEKRVKDFFMLLNSIFYDEDYYYNDLKYNEKEIFGHKEEYFNYLKDELYYFIKKEKEFDTKTDFLQLFMTKKYGKIELFLKSARIEIIEDDQKEIQNEEIKLVTINIPFHLMSLVYLLNGEQIYFLIVILLKKFEIDNIKESEDETSILSDEQKKLIFLEILDMVKFESEKVILDLGQKNYERYNSQLKFLEKIKDLTEVIKYNNFLSSFLKNHNKIKIVDNTFNNIYNTPNYKRNYKINFDTNIDKYTLFILSLEKKYKVNFYLPEIELIFNNYKKQINHFMDKELFIYLYQNNFMYWDYYALHYLFSYKNFRQFMNSILSIRYQSAKYIKKNNNYFLLNAKLKSENSKDFFLNNNPFTKIKKYHLYDVNSYEINLNENCHEFIFMFSNGLNLSIYKFKSFILYAFFININKPVIYEFNFNYQQMKILYYISLFENLTVFLKRLLYFKNDNIYLEYSYFDSFSNMTNQEIYEYFKNVHKMNVENNLYNFVGNQNSLNSLALRICEPYIEALDYISNNESNKIIQSNIKIKNEFLNKLFLINVNTNDWIDKINEYRMELDSKYKVQYEETRNKKIRRQITTQNKSKDLHKIFNKFLNFS